MATNFSFSNRVVHFHFLSQKTCTVNPLLGHGMIKLPTPLPVTRIGVRASYRPHEKLQSEGGLIRLFSWGFIRLFYGETVPPYEKAILNLLEKRDDSSDTDALNLSLILKDMEEKQRLNDLYNNKILKEKHIERMWQIARYCRHSAAVILPREPRSSVEWSGFIYEGGARSFVGSFLHLMGAEGEGEGKLKMTIESDNVQKYRVRVRFQGEPTPERYLYSDVDAKYSDLAIKCGDGMPGKNDQIVLHIRIATPNVLVGQTCNSRKLILVKHYNNE